MATETGSPSGASSSADRERGRPPTIIDLPANDVTRPDEPAATADAAPPPTEREWDAATLGSRSPPPAEPPPFQAAPVEIEGATIAASAPAASAELGAEPATGPAGNPPLAPRRATPFGALLAAAILGGALAALGLVAFDRAGLHPFTATSADPAPRLASLERSVAELRAARNAPAVAAQPAVDLGPIQGELDALKAEVEALKAGPAAPAASPTPAPTVSAPDLSGDVLALGSRLDALAGDVAGLRTSLAEASDADSVADRTLADLGDRLDKAASDIEALTARPVVDLAPLQGEAVALRSDLAGLSERLDQMPTSERVAAVEGAAADATRRSELSAALGPAVAANALGAALDAGAGYAPELSALRSLGVDEARLAPLVPYAAQGLPTLADLRRGFDEAIAPIDLTAPIAADAGALGRLIGSARSLVTVRPANPVAGSDPASVVSRIRAAIDRGDLTAALSEREALPDVAKAATGDWAKLAAARRDAAALGIALRGDALAKVIGNADAPAAPAAEPTP